MFNKRLLVYSDSKIELRVSDNDGNSVFFDNLADFGIDEIKLVDSIKEALGFIFEIQPNFISVGKGRMYKKEAYLSRYNNEEIIQQAYCHWQASLLCSNSSISEVYTVHIDTDIEKRVQITSFEHGNSSDYARKYVGIEGVRSAFANVVSILTGDSVSESTLAHKYYNDGSGHSTIVYF